MIGCWSGETSCSSVQTTGRRGSQGTRRPLKRRDDLQRRGGAMKHGNDYESHLLEPEMRPLQGRVQLLEDDPENLPQRTHEQTSQPLHHGYKQNEKLPAALPDAKRQNVALKEEIHQPCAPPQSYGTFRTAHADGTIDGSVDG